MKHGKAIPLIDSAPLLTDLQRSFYQRSFYKIYIAARHEALF